MTSNTTMSRQLRLPQHAAVIAGSNMREASRRNSRCANGGRAKGGTYLNFHFCATIKTSRRKNKKRKNKRLFV